MTRWASAGDGCGARATASTRVAQSAAVASAGIRWSSPGTMSDAVLTAADTTHGTPLAWASTSVIGAPSYRDGSTSASSAAMTDGMSSRAPASVTRSPRPSRTTAAATPGRSGPSPTRTRCTASCRSAHTRATSTRRCWFFTGTKRPTCPTRRMSSGSPSSARSPPGASRKRVMSMPLGTSRTRDSGPGARRKRKSDASSLHATPTVITRSRTAEASHEYARRAAPDSASTARRSVWLCATRTGTRDAAATASGSAEKVLTNEWTASNGPSRRRMPRSRRA